ncbi:MAG TPA: peptidase M48 [Betaproteobacteria bacterium]|jgi:STE24 endopeptidase|nr:peptidase M48 [Betaproteobacteria bacterium]
MINNAFSYIFLLFVLSSVSIKIWLSMRQIKTVKANQDRVPKAFSEDISLESHQKAANYTEAKMKLSNVSALVDAALLLALTFGGILNWFHDLSSTTTSGTILSGLIFFGLIGLFISLAQLPIDLYKTFVLEEKFGFNKMSLSLFFKDLMIGLAVSAIIGSIFIVGLLWVMETAGINWWWYAWLLAMTFWFFIQYISPTVLAPMFNKFSPLNNEKLKERIEGLLKKCGFQSSGLFVMDGSRRSSHGNAYFTGFGKSKRIVFFDTLINKHSADEIEAVLAHELGHFKLKHVFKLTCFLVLVSLVFFALLGTLQQSAFIHEALNLHAFGSPSLLLAAFYFGLPPFLFLFRPLFAAYLRKNEFEADAYAAQQAPAQELIKALIKLYKDNSSTLTPDKLYSAFYDSHPPASARISRLEASIN